MLSNKKMTDSFVTDAMASIMGMAHIKDAKTKQYIHCNTATLEHFGLKKPEELTGLTTKDLDGFMRPYWGDKYANQIDQMDYVVCTKLETVVRKELTLDRSGFIQLHMLIKMPLIGHNGKVFSILTFSQNLLDTIDLEFLYQLYKNHYSDKKEAVNYFLEHIATMTKSFQSI